MLTMRIQFDYGWYNDDKTVIRYAARDNWTWKDYHAVVHVSGYAVSGADGPVHVLIDFSTGERARFPGGVAAHARTFGKRHNETFSGKAVVIGVPADALAKIGVQAGQVLHTPDGVVQFVDDTAAADAVLAAWGVS